MGVGRERQMDRKAIFTGLLFSSLILFFFITYSGGIIGTQVCKTKDHCASVEIALSPIAQKHALMFYDTLPEDQGMLLVLLRPEISPIWMKNTMIPLDIIWMDKAKKVITIVSDAQPCRDEPCKKFVPRKKALYILELPAGVAKKWKLQIGDKLLFKIP
jgi:uncharacterized membrane protein (UPF0127 family)